MIDSHDDYFLGWLAAFPKGVVVILRVYADESYAETAGVLCGFIATHDEWAKFSLRWKSVLNDFSAPYFHFREFVDRTNRYKIPGNPFPTWNEKRRDRFLIELAIVLSESPVPIGGILNTKEFYSREMEKELNPNELLVAQFYIHFSQRLNAYWPGFDGKVLFVFDQASKDHRDTWTATVSKIHYKAREHEPRIGGLAFEDDLSCPPLQAADLYAYISRQNTEKYYEQGRVRQPKRTLDWIISKNQSPKFKQEHSQEWWEKLVRLVLQDRKRKRALWSRQGEPKKPYIPEIHFKSECERHGYEPIDDSE